MTESIPLGYHQSEQVVSFLRTHKESEQTRQVLYHLFFRGSITPKIAAEEYGITRLAAVIWKLRHIYGFTISSMDESEKNRFGVKTTFSRYYLP